MPTVAEQLKAAREQRGMSLQEVVDTLQLKADHIRALEEGRYTAFAAPVYVRGFTRTYATLLKLNVPELMKQLDAELGGVKKFQDSTSGPREKTFLDWVMLQLSKLDWRFVLPLVGVIIFAVILIFGYRAWRSHSNRDPLADLKPGLYRPAAPGIGETLPVPTNAPAPVKR